VEPFRLITVAKDDEVIEHFDIVKFEGGDEFFS
jgi:hypothetical protein